MKKTMLAAAACLPTLLTAAEGGRPNFIVILADDMGTGDIGAYRELYPGGPEEPRFAARRDPNYPGTLPIQLAHQFTPNLDRLAREGIRCTRGYATAWCAPSRQMLFSGLWANRSSTRWRSWSVLRAVRWFRAGAGHRINSWSSFPNGGLKRAITNSFIERLTLHPT